MINLLHGDCLELMKSIPDKSIDMVLTDPPYGTTACKWDTVIPFDEMWKELKRIIKPKGAILLFGSEPFSSHLRMSNLKMFKYDWIWEKSKPSGISLAKTQPMRNHEIISVFNSSFYFPILEERVGFTEGSKKRLKKIESSKYRNYTSEHNSLKKTDFKNVNKLRNPTTIKRFSSVANRNGTFHPTQKPVELLEYLIKTYTIESETVLDFTMGSGSTGVACKNLNRSFIGIEKDDKYFEIAKQRINA